MPVMIKDFPKSIQKPLREFSNKLKKKKIRMPRISNIKDQTTYHLPPAQRKKILSKELNELTSKIKKYEKEFGKSSEEIIKIEPSDYSHEDEIRDWVSYYYRAEAIKYSLNCLNKL